MMPLWFRALTGKVLARSTSEQRRKAQRLTIRPGVEALEDRTLNSIATLPLPAVPVLGDSGATLVSSETIQIYTGPATASSLPSATRAATAAGDSRAYARLLEDIQALEKTAPETPAVRPPSQWHFRVTGPDTDLGSRAGGDHVFSLNFDPRAGDASSAATGIAPRLLSDDRYDGNPGDIASRNGRPVTPQTFDDGRLGGTNGRPLTPTAPDQVANGLPTPTAKLGTATAPLPASADEELALPERHDLPDIEPAGLLLPSIRSARPETSAGATTAPRLQTDSVDGVLLRRFVVNQDEAAFTALVRRHEQFVFRICQRVLGDAHAAQDALQATFSVLARKASRLDGRGPLAGWLAKVAYHLALRLRAMVARQRRREQDAASGRPVADETDAGANLESDEIIQALKEELPRLPEKYRVPLILCYFEGQTHKDAARALGLPRGSMAKRIGAGLELLRERLFDRGFVF